MDKKYRIIKYLESFRVPNDQLAIDLDNSFFSERGILEQDYYHDDYGLYVNDKNAALAHATGVIKKLQKEKFNDSLKKGLISDFKNYIKCVQYGSGKRSDAYQLLKACLWADCDSEAVQCIMAFHDTSEQFFDEGYGNYRDKILDFGSLYIKAADRALFVKKDIDVALSFYKLAGFKWRCRNHTSNQRGGEEYVEPIRSIRGFTIKDQEEWAAKADLFQQVNLGYSSFDLPESHFRSEKELFLGFGMCLQSLKRYEEKAIILTDSFIDYIGDSFGTVDDKARLSVIMVFSILRNCFLPILFSLSSDNNDIVLSLSKEIIGMLRFLTERRYATLLAWYNTNKNKNELDLIAQTILSFVRTICFTDRLLSLLRAKDPKIESSYYTSYNTFSLMFPDSCSKKDREDECGKLCVMNIAYMNDPNEGIIIRNKLYGENRVPHFDSERKEIKTPYVFIKCFTSMVDYLPMWQMYGDSAKGICIVVEWDNSKDVPLYHMCYLNKTTKGYSVRKEDNKNLDTKGIDEILKKLSNTYESLKTVEERMVFDDLINPILYLFKDSSYSYEQEMRIMYIFDKSSQQIKHTEQIPPKLYVIHKTPLNIKEVILGPKFSNISEMLPYLNEQMEKMADVTRTSQPRVSLSNIDFR